MAYCICFDGDEITAFTQSPIVQSNLSTGTVPKGMGGDINLVSLQQGIIMEEFMIGGLHAILAPRMSSTGLEVALDQTNALGVEYNFGGARIANKYAFQAGDQPAFFEVEFNIEDMSGAGPFIIGWRLRGFDEEDIDNYPDYGSIGMDGATSGTNIVIVSREFPGFQVITDTTDLWGGDDTSNKLRASIDTEGSVTYTINGRAPTVTKSFQFPGGFVAIPFMRFVQAADLSEVTLLSMKVGVQC